MAAAADRDRIAAQYANGFADIFELGLPRLRAGLARWGSERWATTSAYLAFLARLPDSHVARKYGMERAQAVCAMARPYAERLDEAEDPEQLTPSLLAFDRELKAAGINPGTSADLTVASLFAHRIETAESVSRMNVPFLPHLSFPRKRESRAAALSLALDPRFRGGDNRALVSLDMSSPDCVEIGENGPC